MSLACVLVPRFALLTALGGRADLVGRAVALAPEPGGPQTIGEASGTAEAFGVHRGMGLSEALARCPRLTLLPPDAERAEEAWESTLAELEAIGAAVESRRPGEAFFEAAGLRRLWGGVEGVLSRAHRAAGPGGRIGAGPSRLTALSAALRMPRRHRKTSESASRGLQRGGFVVVPAGAARAYLAPLPVRLLDDRPELAPTGSAASRAGAVGLVDKLQKLGIRTLGELAALPDPAVADRFGEPGLAALRMSRGVAERLRPRPAREDIVERFELLAPASGLQLERTLELLVDRLLANPARRGRPLRRLRLAARLEGGGGWRTEVTLRRASGDRERIRLATIPKLAELPGPASLLILRALVFGDAGGDQPSLIDDEQERRHERVGEAVRHVRAAAGREALLRVLEVDPDSRVPERRATLTPFGEGES